MKSICFYFQVHQPYRLRNYRFFDIGEKHDYFDDYNNRFIMQRVAEKSYLPMNKILLDLIKEYGSAFKVSFSISGEAIEQFEAYAPEVLQSFQELAKTGNVEFLAETYAHSLISMQSKQGFKEQVQMHADKVEELFGQKPTTFRNTELIYSDEIGEMVAEMGYKLMLTEGAKHVLSWRSPNLMYANAINPKLKLLLKNFQLSDDIAFRFGHKDAEGNTLTPKKFVALLNAVDPSSETVNLFMDYETFGEHQWEETGIFDFMRQLPAAIFADSTFTFATPEELGKLLQPVSAIHVPNPISWADEERDLTAWLGNELQDEAFRKLYMLEEAVNNCKDPQIQKDWLHMQTSDHFYYMCTKWFSDGAVHKYFNPYSTPYDAFINYMNVLSDFIIRIENCSGSTDANFESFKKAVSDFSEKAEDVVKKTAKSTSKKVKETVAKGKEIKFEDIKEMSDTAVKKLLKEIDEQELTIALKGAGKELTEKVIPNLGKRAKKKFDELENEIKKVKKSDIKKVRNDIEQKIKDLFG